MIKQQTHQASTSFTGSTARLIRLVFIVLTLSTAILTVWLFFAYQSRLAQIESMAYTHAQQQAAEAAATLGDNFGSTADIATTLADDLTSGKQSYRTIERRLRDEVAKRPDIDGLTIAFEPYAYADDVRLHQMYIYKVNGTFEILKEVSYDYTQLPDDDDPNAPQTQWYHNPLENGPVWNEPFLATGAGKVLIEYGVPFFQTDPETGQQVAAGVVAIDYSLMDMRNLITGLELGATGYGYVLSESGTVLAHPVPELVAQTTVFDSPDLKANAELRAAAEKALQGETLSVESRDSASGEQLWTFFMPIEQTGWVIGVDLKKSEFLPDARTSLQDQIAILLSLTAFLVFGSAVVLRIDQGTSRRFWALVITFAIIAIAMMVVSAVLGRKVVDESGVPITSQTTLNRYLESYTDDLKRNTATEPIRIPTGMLIQTMRFADPTALVVNGYIWQHIPRNTDQEITPGFVFPQVIDEPMMVEEVARQESENEEVIVWSVVVTLRQVLDPVRFPLDTHDLQIRLMPADFNPNVILVPDLESYGPPVAGMTRGLERNIWINDWMVQKSWYSFHQQNYDTNFGLNSRLSSGVPELSLSIRVSRLFLGPFIGYLLPGLVAVLMIFAFLLNDQKPDEPEEIVTALNYTAALFFVIVLMHASLRDRVAAISLTYLEYLYLLLYVVIVAVGVNTFIVVRYPHLPLVQFRKNLIVKLLFWPAILIALLVVTLGLFVYG